MGNVFGLVIDLTEKVCANYRVPYLLRVLFRVFAVVLLSLIMAGMVIAGLNLLSDNTLLGILLIALGGVMFMSASGALINKLIRK